MRTASEVQSTRFFPRFRAYADKHLPITGVVADIHEIAKAYRELTSISDWSITGQFLYRWHVMDAGVTTPVVMWLLSNRLTIGTDQLEDALKAMESYLIRRMVCRMTTKDYNKLFLELMQELTVCDFHTVGKTVRAFLASQTADARVWPSDAHVKDIFVTLPLYQLLTRPRLRIILEGLEDALRSPKSEEQHVHRGTLTIEHLMPQGWRQHWAGDLPGKHDGFDEAAQRRDRLVHSIGNLTLVNDHLNPSLSNGRWATKKKELHKHTVLFLNKELLHDAADVWDEETITTRGQHLADQMAKVWPPGDAC